MGQLQTIEPQLIELGYQLVAVSPDRPEKIASFQDNKSFQYRLVSDSGGAGARAFGIAFRMPDDAVDRYKNRFNIDLEDYSGEEHHQLPVPSVFLIGKKGTILFQYVNPNYRVRIPPQILLAAAEVYSDK